MFACLLLYFISMLASLDLDFAILYALCGLVLVWSHLSLLRIDWVSPLVRNTFVVLVCLIHAFLHFMRCWYAHLACFAPPISLSLLLCIFHDCLHVYALVCMSSILQSNGTIVAWSKPTFVLLRHPLLLDNMFVCLFMCFTCLFAPTWHLFLACH